MSSSPAQCKSGSQELAECLALIRQAGSPSNLRERVTSLWPGLRAGSLAELIIVGAAGEGVRLAQICSTLGVRVLAVADDDPKKLGQVVAATQVVAVDSLHQQPKSVPVVIASHRALLPTRRLREMGFATVLPLMALQVMDPARFPPHMFHAGLLEDLVENLGQYERLAELLADDFSARVLAAVIRYRLDGDPEVLSAITEWELYGPGALLSYGDDEVYVDGGTFDGDSIRLFMNRVGGKFDRIIGFEPDPATFRRLRDNFADEPRVEPINAGLHARAGTLKFDDAGTRGSILSDSGTISVPVMGLDELLKGDRVSYIKMNIEGAEIDALEGARQAIKKWSPKLAVSAYHYPDHLWKVPFKISELDSSYRIHFRQHDGGIIETVCYAQRAE